MADQEEKKIAAHTFEGGLNSDIAPEIQPPNTMRHAINIRILSTAGGNQGIITTCKGNIEVAFDLPAGQNDTVGRYPNPETNKFFFFNWNSNGFHGIYFYDYLLNTVTPILLNLTDTGNVDILHFVKGSLILHIDLVGDKLYWANKDIKPSKINIKKALDKSATGYGNPILQEFINAYKLAPVYPPVMTYFTDTTRLSNYLYQNLFKSCSWFIYDDFETSNTSEYSTVALPQNESFTGNPAVSNLNNCLKIRVETGSKIVKQIKIGIKVGSLDFVEIVTLDKAKLGISDNTTYEYSFYNDNTSFIGLVQLWVARAFSFFWRHAGLQRFTDNAMIYGDMEEGFEVVDVNLSSQVLYGDLFLPSDTVNVINSPEFTVVDQMGYFTRKGHGRRTNEWVKLRIGHDVKAGNNFQLSGTNGNSDNPRFAYLAGLVDDAISIANNIKQQLVATGRILDSAEGLPDSNIWDNDINGSGDVTFTFIFRGVFDETNTTFSTLVNAVSTATLKNNGQSVLTHKSGGSVKYGPYYRDDDGRRSAIYGDDGWYVHTDFVTQTNGFKKVTHRLSIKNQPPIWATHWGIGRTVDLVYGTDWIQFLVQKTISSTTTPNTDYQDLVIGSLNTYQRIHPTSIVSYQFEKNDRVRLIRTEPNGAFITFTETVLLEYLELVEDVKNENVTTNGTATVVIGGSTTDDNIGRYISVQGVERQITAVNSGTQYQLDRVLTFDGDGPTFPTYKIIDRRGIIRVRKPLNFSIDDNTLIEVYKPTQNVATQEKDYFLFGQLFPIKNAGTSMRAHTGNIQDQDPGNPIGTPAIVDITKGTSYVRLRELPTNNSVPGTQVVIDNIESQTFSDYYESDLNDNGKIDPEDNGQGLRTYGDRLWFSENYIQDTGVNGLSDFYSSNREDYPDSYGKFVFLFFWKKLLYAFKVLRDTYIPINASVIRDEQGEELLKATTKLLNPIQYLDYDGGIGDKPESHAADQTWQWHLYPNAGVVGRIGGNGVLPVSEQFFLDDATRKLIAAAEKYNVKVFGEIDRENGEYLLAFQSYTYDLYNGEFGPNWILFSPTLSPLTVYEITTNAVHGVVTMGTVGGLPIFNYNPTHDYVGPDYFYYRWMEPDGAWSALKKQCIEVTDPVTTQAVPIYYNTLLSTNFTKNDCGDGRHGSVVPYVVPALKYSSFTSYDDAGDPDSAQQQARDATTANGQQFANDTGTCALNDPNPFSFIDQSGLELDTLTGSNYVTISGIYDTYLIDDIPGGGEYRIGTGPWLTEGSVLNNAAQLQLRNTTASTNDTTVSTIPTVGTLSDEWTIRTKSAGGLAWRVQPASITCGTGDYEGYVIYTVLEQYTVADGINTGMTKANVDSDPDYIAPNYDPETCPIAGTQAVTAKLADSEGAICGNPDQTLYFSGSGHTAPWFNLVAYISPALTFYATTDFIEIDGVIYNLDSGTGQVKSPTGGTCP